MGRYYSGDIEGKFWFGVQPSNDADFFGQTGEEPNYLNYYFNEDDKDEIKKGIDKCKQNLGKYETKINEFFDKHKEGYNDEMMEKELKIKTRKVKELLTWYARKILGEKILKCVEEKGECNFEAEL